MFKGPYAATRHCLLGREAHTYAFEYLYDFLNKSREYNSLSVLILMEGHEFSGDLVATLEPNLLSFLDSDELDLSNTALFILSDHGNHMSPAFVTGRLSEVFTCINSITGTVQNLKI